MTTGKSTILEVDHNVWALDTLYQGEPGVIASYLLAGSGGLALVDVGPTSTVENVLQGIRQAGYDPREVKHLLLTHVHLDHAGATGTLIRLLPQATAYVHTTGATHLVDPSRLIRSAARIYGDRLNAMWGEFEPVPSHKLRIIEDGDSIVAGDRTLRVLYTPGHAVHHVSYYDSDHDAAFTGDVAGVRLQGSAFVRPPTPPPDLDLKTWHASIARLEDLKLRTIYLAHYGRYDDVPDHLKKLHQSLDAWGEFTLAEMKLGKEATEIATALAAVSNAEIQTEATSENRYIERYEIATSYLMSVQGYVRYYEKHHPELLGRQ